MFYLKSYSQYRLKIKVTIQEIEDRSMYFVETYNGVKQMPNLTREWVFIYSMN